MPGQTVAPTEIRLSKDKRGLTLVFNDGRNAELSAEYLRVNSPSAEVQGHSPRERRVVAGKKDIEIMTVVPVGRYAIRIGFTDMHDTGIFSWGYLRELADQRDTRWPAYLAELEEHGLSREPPARKG